MHHHFTVQHFILEHLQTEFIKLSVIFRLVRTLLRIHSVDLEPTTEGTSLFTIGGYVLKYMYTISASNVTKFLTTDFMLVETDSTVSAGLQLMVRLNPYE